MVNSDPCHWRTSSIAWKVNTRECLCISTTKSVHTYSNCGFHVVPIVKFHHGQVMNMIREEWQCCDYRCITGPRPPLAQHPGINNPMVLSFMCHSHILHCFNQSAIAMLLSFISHAPVSTVRMFTLSTVIISYCQDLFMIYTTNGRWMVRPTAGIFRLDDPNFHIISVMWKPGLAK